MQAWNIIETVVIYHTLQWPTFLLQGEWTQVFTFLVKGVNNNISVISLLQKRLYSMGSNCFCLIQHFEAEFLRKVSLKILKLGLIQKTSHIQLHLLTEFSFERKKNFCNMYEPQHEISNNVVIMCNHQSSDWSEPLLVTWIFFEC